MPYGRAGIISSSIAVVIYIGFEDLGSEIFREEYLGGSLVGTQTAPGTSRPRKDCCRISQLKALRSSATKHFLCLTEWQQPRRREGSQRPEATLPFMSAGSAHFVISIEKWM